MTLSSATYPISLVVNGLDCLVVGGGPVATRKASGLLNAGAKVTVVARTVTAELAGLGPTIHLRPYESGEAASFRLVIAATGIPEVDHLVAADATSAGVFVNVADDPAYCSFTLPAIARLGMVTIAVSSEGTSPALSSFLRDTIAREFADDAAFLGELIGSLRSELRASGRSSEGHDWHALIGELLAIRKDRGDDAAGRAGKAAMRSWQDQSLKPEEH